MTDNSSQTVETVLGPIPISELGETLTHEHLGSCFYKRNKFLRSPYLNTKCISLSNIQALDFDPYHNIYNINLNDDDAVRNLSFEVSLFKRNRGKTIVNTSSFYNTDHYTDLFLLRTLSKMTGVNVIVGSVVADSPKSQNSFQEHIYNELKRSLIEGNRFFTVDESPIIKSAFIGETPCYNYDEAMAMQLTENEKIFLSMTGQVQNELHCPVTLYPANNSSLPEEIMRIYQEAGGDSSKAIMSHVDLAFSKKQKFMEFVDDTNCYLEFSLFGNPSSLEIGNDILSDAQRIKRIKRLKEEGKLNRVLMSHDIHTKNRLVSYGGLGLGHISKNILPLMLKRGIHINDIKIIMIENPKNWLSYDQTLKE